MIASNAFKVGIKLIMTGNAAGYLGALSKHLLGLNVKVGQLQGKFKNLELAMKGALSVYAGEKTLTMMGRMIAHGNELVHQQQQLRTMGYSQQEVTEATARAMKVASAVQTTTLSENVKHLRELSFAFGDMATAQSVLQNAAKLNAVLQSAVGNEKADQVWEIVKSAELKGLTQGNPAQFEKFMQAMGHAVVASGGKVDPRQYFRSVLYGRTAMQGWSIDFMEGPLARLIQSMGNSGAGGRSGPGNALMTAFGEIANPSPSNIKALRRYHLMNGREVAGKDLFITNPYEWVQQILMPRLAKAGVAVQGSFDEEKIKGMFGDESSWNETKLRNDVIGVIARIFPTRTSGQVITEQALQGRFLAGSSSQFEKDIRKINESMNYQDAFDLLSKHDTQYVMLAFQKQWDSMLEALSAPLVPIAIVAMKGITDVFTAITKVAIAFPTLFKALGEIVVVLAGLAIGRGTLAIIVAAVRMLTGVGAIARGLGIAGAALGGGTVVAEGGLLAAALGPGGWLILGFVALAYIEWPTIMAGLKGLILWLHSLAPSVFAWSESHDSPAEARRKTQDARRQLLQSGNPLAMGLGADSTGDMWGRVYHWLFGDAKAQTDATKKNTDAVSKLNETIKAPAWNSSHGTVPFLMHKSGFRINGGAPLGGTNSGSNWNNWLAAQSYLETSYRNTGNSRSSAHGYFQFLSGTAGRAIGAGLADPRAGGYNQQATATMQYIKRFHPAAATAIERGDYAKATMLLRGEWPSLPGGSQSQSAGRYGTWSQILQGMGPRPPGESGAIPPPGRRDVHLSTTVKLDGRVVAKNTAKHLVKMGDSPSGSSKVPDYWGTRPPMN